jgi:hypothetical protein
MANGIFEKASRAKLRFDTPRGRLTPEDLWHLPLIGGDTCLDEIAKGLSRAVQDSGQESFVLKTNEPNEALTLGFDVVKHIIDVRLLEKEAAENAERARQKKQQILSIIADKEVESLKESSIDELRELVKEL